MPTIACLGWGSLIWDPRDLPIRGGWSADGPLVEVDFVRQSMDGRITLVLHPTGAPIPCFWAPMREMSLDEAWDALRRRERIPENDRTDIGLWSKGEEPPGLVHGLPAWAEARDFDSVIWTALPPRFDGRRGRVPATAEVIAYLSALEGADRERAETYIRRAPRQTATPNRRAIETALGWTCVATEG